MRIAIQVDKDDRDAGCDYPDFCVKCYNSGRAKRKAEVIVAVHPEMEIDTDMDPEDHPPYSDGEYFCECCERKLTDND
jgi:hypothetical protein|tara:strand:+ start:1486 stop:1719 length:234 start_codon:yes stop_codon:yes gene_type:complete